VRWLSALARRTPAREAAKSAAHAVEAKTALAWDADLALKHSQSVSNVLASLTQTKDAIVRIGPILIVKVNWAVAVHQLTLAQQFDLEHAGSAALTVEETLCSLGLAMPTTSSGTVLPPA
jgi:hypothetical protein